MHDDLDILEQQIVSCERCPRLREWCTEVARARRRAFRNWEYWGRPVPGFGDPQARLLLLGLAPAAHGANRTGRLFTGDRSGDLLCRAMWHEGFASQPASTHRGDGLQLIDAWVSASLRCAPPANKPAPGEIVTCRDHLQREVALLENLRVVVALGRIAFDNWLRRTQRRSPGTFGHNVLHDLGPGTQVLISSYHPSQQNTQTGRLTLEMFIAVFARAAAIIRA